MRSCISPVSRLYLPISRLHLAYISPTSRLHLAHISPTEVRIPELYDAGQAETAQADLAPLPPEQLARLTVSSSK